MGKGTVPGGTELYMGTAALSERDYVHEAIEQADLIITIGHDTIEKPPFIMGKVGPNVVHVGYQPATVEQVYFPQSEVIGDIGPSLKSLADRLEASSRTHSALLHLREHILEPDRRAGDGRSLHAPAARPRHSRGHADDGILALDNGMFKIWFARNYRTQDGEHPAARQCSCHDGRRAAVGDDGRRCCIRSAVSWRSAAMAAS